jgi:hypothetical protein
LRFGCFHGRQLTIPPRFFTIERLTPELAFHDVTAPAGRWFLQSGIQDPGGGVARYFRSDIRENAPVSTEITGYAASMLLFLHSETGGEEYLARALSTGRFLTRCAWDRDLGVMPFEFSGGTSAHAYFFDCGIIARSLVALWRHSGDPEFLEAARACARSMAADFDAGADFHPILELPSKQPALRDHRWSRSPGCYQLKAALAWRELAEDAGQVQFAAHYARLLDYSLATHEGFLPGEPDLERVMDRLHAFCYFLEGLLPVASRPDCAAVLRAGVERVASFQDEIAPRFERSDVRAALLRLRIFSDALGLAALDLAAAEQEAAAIAAFQAGGSDPHIAGGFYFGRRAGELLPFINPVSTAFCAQALALWRGYRAGKTQPDWRTLV